MADSHEWDAHGFPANTATVQFNDLRESTKYKVSNITLFDQQLSSSIGPDDALFQRVKLIPGNIYQKSQLQKELETLADCGLFEKVDLEANSNPDGSINITILFLENTWDQIVDRFRFIKLAPKSLFERCVSLLFDYMSSPCLLPVSVQGEILQMVKEQEKLSRRIFERVRERVHNWYESEGYGCAQVVSFENLGGSEVVCEVMEGDITRVVIQFHDQFGNVCCGNKQLLPLIEKVLPKQLCKGQVFNVNVCNQALANMNLLGIFSSIEIVPRWDEQNERGIVVEVRPCVDISQFRLKINVSDKSMS